MFVRTIVVLYDNCASQSLLPSRFKLSLKREFERDFEGRNQATVASLIVSDGSLCLMAAGVSGVSCPHALPCHIQPSCLPALMATTSSLQPPPDTCCRHTDTQHVLPTELCTGAASGPTTSAGGAQSRISLPGQCLGQSGWRHFLMPQPPSANLHFPSTLHKCVTLIPGANLYSHLYGHGFVSLIEVWLADRMT